MRPRWSRFGTLAMTFVILGAVLLAAAPSMALVIKETPAQLWDRAELVVVGTVSDTRSMWEGNAIVTLTEVAISRVLKGAPSAPVVTVRTPGGEVGDLSLVVSDVPYFERGEHVLLFLGPENGAYRVEGWFQGRLTIYRDTVVEYGLPVSEFLERLTNGNLPAIDARPGTGYKKCGYDWKLYGTYTGGKYGPGNQGWSVNNNSHDGLSDSQVSSAMNAGAAVWNGAGACWNFGTRSGSITHDNITTYSRNNVNLITFGETGGSVATTYIWVASRKNIVEVDLVFSDFEWDFGVPACGSGSKFDLQNVATHEMGHWLCLGDLYGSGDSQLTMYGYVDYGWCQQRTLATGDVNGIKVIYGTCAGREVAQGGEPSLDMSIGPAPAGAGSTVSYRLAEESWVLLRIYDVTGREVRTLADGLLPAGEHAATWDGLDGRGHALAPGVYFCRLEAGEQASTQKVVLMTR